MSTQTMPTDDYILSRNDSDDSYGIWQFDVHAEQMLSPLPLGAQARFDRTHQLIPIGRYLLEWGPLMLQEYQPSYPYRLFEFNPALPNPLKGPALHSGIWTKAKFWNYRADFGNPNGAKESYDSGQNLMLLPLGGFVLNVIPTMGRGTFQLWNFDPNPLHLNPGDARSGDPLPAPFTPQGSFDTIDYDHELLPMGNYVLDRVAASGEYWVWSFDPQATMPLGLPALQQGSWSHITAEHQLVPMGEYVMDWLPSSGAYRLWTFDPTRADPLVGPLRTGVLPEGLRTGSTLTMVQQPRSINAQRAATPGTMDFMRSKIKHVVYLMLENRSFDHICGWLYNKDDVGIRFVGHDAPFDGASAQMFNMDPGAPGQKEPEKVMLTQYKGGELSRDWDLDFLPNDPFHDKTDVLRQYFYGQKNGYEQRLTPQMGGFVWNNGVHDVMQTYSPKQLPILNGLARNYAVSDAWYCSMPSATDPNRAFAFTGSALGQLNNFQNGNTYINWPTNPHRQSIWKALWTNGFTDWKLYHSVEWLNYVHTYHLYLQGTIPSVDTAISANPTSFLQTLDQFKSDAAAGKLPAFSFLEPIWIAMSGTTSYHPGADPLVGEIALNSIYDALRNSPSWNETLFIITFDEHGGVFDHAPPPYAVNPWPNDVNDGFRYDLLGVRVPTIMVSPLIEEQTVFRSAQSTAYDATSILATVLHWAGVPKARWCMGERVQQAPTFEAILQRAQPRANAPALKPAYDHSNPGQGDAAPAPARTARVSELHHLMVPRILAAIAKDKLGGHEIQRLAEQILRDAADAPDLHRQIGQFARKLA